MFPALASDISFVINLNDLRIRFCNLQTLCGPNIKEIGPFQLGTFKQGVSKQGVMTFAW